MHEHWYRVWTGQESIRDLHYYYPLPRLPPVLALSSWYPMVLGAIVLGFLTIALALVRSGAGIARTVRHVGTDLGRTLQSVPGVLLAVLLLLLLVLLWVAVLWVYLPSRGVLPAAQLIEVQTYSPR